MICEVKQYVDEETGGMIIEKIDAITEETVSYTGMAQIPIRTPEGIQGMPIEFLIEADDIGAAFLEFEESLKARLEEMKEEQEKAQVERAGAIVGLDGQPLDAKQDPLQFPGQ